MDMVDIQSRYSNIVKCLYQQRSESCRQLLSMGYSSEAKVGLWSYSLERILVLLNFGVEKDCWEYYEYYILRMDRWTINPEFSLEVQVTNFKWSYSEYIQSNPENSAPLSNLKCWEWWKERGQLVTRTMDSVTTAIGALLESWKASLGIDHPG